MTTVQHLVVGKAYIDHYGTMHIRSSLSSLSAQVKYGEPLFGASTHKVASSYSTIRLIVSVMTLTESYLFLVHLVPDMPSSCQKGTATLPITTTHVE